MGFNVARSVPMRRWQGASRRTIAMSTGSVAVCRRHTLSNMFVFVCDTLLASQPTLVVLALLTLSKANLSLLGDVICNSFSLGTFFTLKLTKACGYHQFWRFLESECFFIDVEMISDFILFLCVF